MTVIEDEELEKIFNRLEKIDIEEVKPENIKFIAYSCKGAMGSPGDFIILTDELKVSENNYLYGNLTIDNIIKIIPEFKKLDYKNYLGDNLNNWDTLNMGYGNYLFVNKSISKDFYKNISYYITFKKNNYDPQELYLNWLFGALITLKIQDKKLFIFKENRISKKDFIKLKEDDLMFITNPGRMGDEDGSTFVIKKDNNFIVYRIDGWMYPKKDEKDHISMEEMFKVFPKWKDTWNNYYKEGYDGKYIYIYTGFGNGLCIDKRIFDEFLPYLSKEVKRNGWDTPIDLIETNPGVASSWQQAMVNMINNRK